MVFVFLFLTSLSLRVSSCIHVLSGHLSFPRAIFVIDSCLIVDISEGIEGGASSSAFLRTSVSWKDMKMLKL